MERSELGKRIAAACALRGITMGSLANRIGVSRNTLSRIVTGATADPASSIIINIARELHISTDHLYGLTEDMIPKAA
jgi:transcriptional regulator with XRE-family HTH domain